MIQAVYIFFIIANLFLFFTSKQKKTSGYITELFIIFFVSCKQYLGGKIAYDLQHYQINYLYKEDMSEIGFKFIRDLFIQLDLSFSVFYLAIVITCVLLIFRSVRKIGGDVRLFSVAYLIYFILIPIDQLKNICAFTLFLIFLPYLINGKKSGIIIYIFGVLLSALFHPSFIVYGVFVLCFFIPKNRYIVFLPFAIILLCLFIVFGKMQHSFATIVERVLSPLNSYFRYDKYLSTTSNMAPLAMVSIYFVLIVLILYRKTLIEKKQCLPNTENYNNSIIFSIASIGGLFLLPLFLSMTMYRYVRDMCLFLMPFLTKEIWKTKPKNKFVVSQCIIAISLGLFVYDIVLKNYWSDYMDYFFVLHFPRL